VEAHPRVLARVRRHVCDHARAHGLPEPDARALTLAVDEAAANAIEHGMAGRPRGVLTVRAEPADGHLAVVLRYRGPRFDPPTAPRAGPAEALGRRARHGYGLLLIERLVHEIRYGYAGGVNELRLIRRLPPRPLSSARP
ncbi:MAG: ATP-binding protein, partial [Rubricoccaceae bacterium]